MPDDYEKTPPIPPADSRSGRLPISASDEALASDPDYETLVLKYQNAEWEECDQLIDQLLKKYPGSKRLVDFQTDLNTQKALHRMGEQDAAKRRQSQTRNIFKNLGFVFILLAVGALLVLQILNTYQKSAEQNSIAAQQLQVESLKTMEAQARALLQAGKPDLALTIVEKIEAVDPNYAAIGDLRGDAMTLIELSSVYDQAVLLMDQENYDAALPLLQQIQSQSPLFRDVPSRIEVIDQHNKVLQLVAEGEQAFLDQRWDAVIENYEQALELDPDANTEKIKQQLLSSYLRSVIAVLSEDNPSIEKIQLAEQYYHSASALIPQSKVYSAERDNLQKLSVQLLATKYYQIGKIVLEDPNHTEKMVAAAVDYMNRALALNPNDSQLTSEVGKAQIYLAALRNFSDGEWEEAIKQLTALSNFDANYPNGMGLQLLYEAYRARGLRYYRGGFYLDARKNFEAAEILAYEHPENKLRLLEIQINIGNTLGKLDDVQNAASYYQYAFTTAKAAELGAGDPKFAADLKAADELFAQGKYYEAFTTYQSLAENVQTLYSYTLIGVGGGESLAFLASRYNSSMNAIRTKNGLGDSLSMQFTQTLSIPTIP